MNFKGAFKDSHFLLQLVLLAVIFFFGLIGSSLTSYVVIFFKCNFSVEAFNEVVGNLEKFPSSMREIQFFTALGAFVFPALACAYLFSDDKKTYLQMETPIVPSVAIWTVLSMFFALPLLNFTLYLNQQMVLPEGFAALENLIRNMEDEMARMTEAMMYAENIWALIFNIVIIAILAGLGEEFFFRGVLQNIFRKAIKNEHIIIWSVAIIFSAIHMQFYGFLPRMLMGAYFGYLLFYTKNIWIPVLAHFANNFFSVMAFYYYQDTDKMKDMDALGTQSTWWLAVASLALWFWAFQQIRKKSSLQHLAS